MRHLEQKKQKVAVIGLGYVGLPLAVELGKNRDVLGLDISESRISELKDGFDRTNECSKKQLEQATKLKFSSKEGDLAQCGIFIITVPTPIDSANRPDLSHLKAASELVGSHIKPGSLIIYESTVFPGATEEFCVPIIEKISGLRFNVDFSCGYSPERINPGDKTNTITKIQKIVSGSNHQASIAVQQIYDEIIDAGTYLVSGIKVAEAAKVIENAQRDLNIAFVNELSVIFEQLGIDTVEVLEAAGTKWNFLPFRPGMVGGHCIGVDPYYLTHKAEQLGYTPQIILAGRRVNDDMAKYAALNIVKRMTKMNVDISKSRVAILGVTFKENCPDVRNSKVFDLIHELQSWNIEVLAVDPWADKIEITRAYSFEMCDVIEAQSCDAVVVAVGHQEYREMTPLDLIKFCKSPTTAVLGDIKSIYDKSAAEQAGFSVFRF